MPLLAGPAPRRTRPPARARSAGSPAGRHCRPRRPAIAATSAAGLSSDAQSLTTWTRSPNRPTEPAGSCLPAARRPPCAARRRGPPGSRPRISCLHLVRRAAGQQPAAVDQGQAIAPLGLVEIGRGDEDRHLLAEQLVEDPPEIAARDGIDAVGRLVEEEDLGGVDQARRPGRASASCRRRDCPPGGVETAPGC